MNEDDKIKILLKFVEGLRCSIGTWEFCKALFESHLNRDEQQIVLDVIQEHKGDSK